MIKTSFRQCQEKGGFMIASQDVNGKRIYSDDTHQFIWLGADPENREGVGQTNQYLIINKGRGVLLDPGGIHLFSRVVAVASRYISLDKIDSIRLSLCGCAFFPTSELSTKAVSSE